MDTFTNPRLADHGQGLELRIIELTGRIERARRWPGSGALVARLERKRRRLVDELARTTADAVQEGASRVTIHAPPVRRRRRLA